MILDMSSLRLCARNSLFLKLRNFTYFQHNKQKHQGTHRSLISDNFDQITLENKTHPQRQPQPSPQAPHQLAPPYKQPQPPHTQTQQSLISQITHIPSTPDTQSSSPKPNPIFSDQQQETPHSSSNLSFDLLSELVNQFELAFWRYQYLNFSQC